jgi:hypothetical protein
MSTSTHHLINVSFPTRVEKTDRVIDVAESFGIGLADGQFTIFKDFEVELEQGARVYITGQSGAGKSILLRELERQLAEKGKRVANIEEVKLDPDLPLIDQVGKTTNEASRLLTTAGITDAYLFVRKPGELSDGQRYRARLAKVIEADADVWVADEFGAVLDRVVAKAVAYGIAKNSIRLNKTLIVATTHLDLKDEIGPTLFVNKRYHDRIEVERQDLEPRE